MPFMLNHVAKHTVSFNDMLAIQYLTWISISFEVLCKGDLKFRQTETYIKLVIYLRQNFRSIWSVLY